MSASLITTDSDTNLARIEMARLGFDPQAQPFVDIPLLPSIAAPYLSPKFIEMSFKQSVEWDVEPLLKDDFVTSFEAYPKHIPSAVCLPLVQRERGLTVLLTRRAGHLPAHPGQVCFPGGRIDLTDNNATHTALRETFEEVGIAPGYIQPLGKQPILITGTNYAMCPIVGLVKKGFTVNPDPAEVGQVFEVPLAVLMDPEYHRLQAFRRSLAGEQSVTHYYFSISWNGYYIWGATAAVLRNFYHYLMAASKQIALNT